MLENSPKTIKPKGKIGFEKLNSSLSKPSLICSLKMDCETRLEEEPCGNSFPIGKTETNPILSRLSPLTEPLQNPQNHRIHQPTNRPKTPEFACARPIPQKKLRFLEKKKDCAPLGFLFFSVLQDEKAEDSSIGSPAEYHSLKMIFVGKDVRFLSRLLWQTGGKGCVLPAFSSCIVPNYVDRITI